MSWAIDQIELSSGNIDLKPLQSREVDEVAAAIYDPLGWSAKNWGTDSLDKTQAFLRKLLEYKAKQQNLPLVYRINGEIAGLTSIHHVSERRGSLEIGFTCVVPKWRRTNINTSKNNFYLTTPLRNLNAARVELRVDQVNYNSQMAVLRLGATF